MRFNLAHSWSTIGLSVIIFLAGLKAVGEDLDAAFKVTGATRLQQFRYMIMPALSPVTAVVFVLTLTQSLKVFDLVCATTQGGPIRFKEILSTCRHKLGALENDFGCRSVIGVALLVILNFTSNI